jgi:hypothetical protein
MVCVVDMLEELVSVSFRVHFYSENEGIRFQRIELTPTLHHHKKSRIIIIVELT